MFAIRGLGKAQQGYSSCSAHPNCAVVHPMNQQRTSLAKKPLPANQRRSISEHAARLEVALEQDRAWRRYLHHATVANTDTYDTISRIHTAKLSYESRRASSEPENVNKDRGRR